MQRILAFLLDSVLIGVIGLPFTLLAPFVGDLAALLLLSVYIVLGLVYALLLEGCSATPRGNTCSG
jgi:RDD family.